MIVSGRPTESLCPICLRAVPAALVQEADEVVLHGECPEHGAWRTPVWSGLPSWESWCGEPLTAGPLPADGGLSGAGSPATPCPGGCGLCARHEQHTCTAVLEITRRCDLGCPICFAESSSRTAEPDLTLPQIIAALHGLFADQGAVNLQLSGGEPTMRDDLPDVIGAARTEGFTFVQLNTNGLRLASRPGYAEELRDAGLVSVFLQFDGLEDETYLALRGRPLTSLKLRAVERCAEAGLAVVLVPTVVPGVNDHELGSLVRFAAGWPGIVRGLHMQPVSYFGRYFDEHRPRLTLPEVLRLLEDQTSGEVRTADFAPSSCEHVRCTFRARYWVRDGGRLEALQPERSCCSPKPGTASQRAIAATSRQWSRRQPSTTGATAPPRGPAAGGNPGAGDTSTTDDDLSRFLEEASRILCISGMMFQDAWNIDLQRVRRCCVHVVVPDRGLVPFCLWNLTSAEGRRLYERR